MIRSTKDRIFKLLISLSGYLTILLLGGFFLLLIYNSIAFFLHLGSLDFFTGFLWDPNNSYSILPLVVSTAFVAFGSMIIAIPVGVITAVYISELSPPKLKLILKPCIEILASVPSVAIGFLGIVLLGPGIAKLFNIPNGLNALNGSILLSIMALPTIISVCEDAINAVPNTYKEASYALGANKWTTLFRVTIPAAAPGILAGTLLGLGRALGETMTVLMATGNVSTIPSNFLDSVRTITATVAIEMGEVPYQSTHYYSLFAIAAILFLITLSVNLIGEYLSNRFRKFHHE